MILPGDLNLRMLLPILGPLGPLGQRPPDYEYQQRQRQRALKNENPESGTHEPKKRS